MQYWLQKFKKYEPYIMISGLGLVLLAGFAAITRIPEGFLWIRLVPAFFAQLCAFLAAAIGWWLMLIYMGCSTTFSRTLRHTAIMLVGKYFPGGVFGLLGRSASVAGELGRRSALRSLYIEQGSYYGVAISIIACWWLAEYFEIPFGWAGFIIAFSMILVSLLFGPSVFVAMMFSILQWIFGVLGFFLLVSVVLVPAANFADLAVIYPAAVLFGLLVPVLPAGIGIREGALVWLSTTLLGMDLNSAILLAALLRCVLVLRDLLVGGVCLLVFR